MKYNIKEKTKLIPTNFPTAEKQQFWAEFNKHMTYVAEMSPNGIWWGDFPNGNLDEVRVLYINDRAINMIGLTPQRVIGKNPHDFYPDEIANAALATIRHAVCNEERYEGHVCQETQYQMNRLV